MKAGSQGTLAYKEDSEAAYSSTAINSALWGVWVGGLGIPGQTQPHGKFEASIAYLRPYFKKEKKMTLIILAKHHWEGFGEF